MTTRQRPSPAAIGVSALLVAFCLSVTTHSATSPSIRLVYGKQVSITVTVALIDRTGTHVLHEQTLEGTADERLMLDTLLTRQGRDIPWSFRASFKVHDGDEASHEDASEVEWRTRTALGRNEPTRTHRRSAVENGRLTVAEIWGRKDPPERLVMQVNTQWTQVPQLVRTAPTAEPIGLIIEVLGRRNERIEVLESHRVFGLVGDESKISFERSPEGGDTSDEVHVTVIPHHVGKEGIRIGLRIRYRETLEGGTTVPTIRNLTEDVPAGSSITLDIPEAEGRPSLAVRVTPFF